MTTAQLDKDFLLKFHQMFEELPRVSLLKPNEAYDTWVAGLIFPGMTFEAPITNPAILHGFKPCLRTFNRLHMNANISFCDVVHVWLMFEKTAQPLFRILVDTTNKTQNLTYIGNMAWSSNPFLLTFLLPMALLKEFVEIFEQKNYGAYCLLEICRAKVTHRPLGVEEVLEGTYVPKCLRIVTHGAKERPMSKCADFKVIKYPHQYLALDDDMDFVYACRCAVPSEYCCAQNVGATKLRFSNLAIHIMRDLMRFKNAKIMLSSLAIAQCRPKLSNASFNQKYNPRYKARESMVKTSCAVCPKYANHQLVFECAATDQELIRACNANKFFECDAESSLEQTIASKRILGRMPHLSAHLNAHPNIVAT